MNMGVVTAGAWIAQLSVAIFFIVGFVEIYMSVWHIAFRKLHTTQSRRMVDRIMLIVLSVGVSSLLHFAGYEGGINAMLYHNVGLFILTFSLMDADINAVEYAIRGFAVVIIWMMHHVGDLTSGRFLFSMVFLFTILVVIRYRHKTINKNFVENILVYTLIGLNFWLTLPAESAGMLVSIPVATEGILMFILMTLFTWRQCHVVVRNNQISHIANYDTMTGVKNFTAYNHEIFNAVGVARTNQQPLSLAEFDVDHFKQINDTYGHLAGNLVLTGVSMTVQKILKQYSHDYQLYRTGGEEFAMSFPNSSAKEIIPVLIHCWQAVREQTFTYNTDKIKVTISIGMSSLRPGDKSVDDLYKRADDSLYNSKRFGRDTITVDGKEQKIISDTHHNTFAYFVQSIYDVKSGNTHIANELTLRCYNHKKGKWEKPDRAYLNIDERLKLIGQALINSDCKKIVISLSTAEFLDLKVAKKIIEFRKGVDGPEKLVIELDQVPTLEELKRSIAIYHQGGIKVMLSQVGRNRHFERVSPALEYIDGIKLTLKGLRDKQSSEFLKDNIQFWGRIADKWHIDFILDGVLTQQEAQFVPTQSFVTYVEGNYFDQSHLPIGS
ncbi:GGDEF domain-containing protein [Pediococcus cellicola]|nr:diguanylate cyclase [Pediococcus cellicola]